MNSLNRKPCIALLQGDACGIGPELMSKLLADDAVRARANLLIVSDKRVFENGDKVTGNITEVRIIERMDEVDFSDGIPNLLDTKNINPADITPGVVSKLSGAAVLENLGFVVDLAKNKVVDGICFTPFNKDALHQGGMDVDDELSWIKQRLNVTSRSGEFNVVDGMWNARVTSHVPIKDVAGLLTVERILQAILLSDETLKAAGFDRPRIAVAALNPHAGDGGTIGREEIDIIAPAIEKAKAKQINVAGPFPSDTLYLKVRDGDYDCAVSMFHDQGQIAIKLLGFHKGVTVHAGLPMPIATPAHGTAFDIVGTNTANVVPTLNAFMMVADMIENHK